MGGQFNLALDRNLLRVHDETLPQEGAKYTFCSSAVLTSFREILKR